MYLQGFGQIIQGYVNVDIEGFYIEKVINICKKNSIALSSIDRKRATLITTNIPVSQFKMVAKIVKQNKCKIKIKQKRGVPFLLKKYRKRKIFFVALILVVGALLISSRFIWNIDIVGNNSISAAEILEIAKQEGLDIGKLKSKINAKDVVEKIRIEKADISWVGIKISGTNARIEVVEADLAPKIINKDEYCNIVATKDAIVEKIYAQNGCLQVNQGDEVKKGDILIGGWLEGKYTGTRYMHATGKVMAKVCYKEKVKVYYNQNVKKMTGNKEKRYSLYLNNFAINFYKRLSKFEIYDTISTEKKLKVSSNFYLPFKIIVKENSEAIEENVTYTVDEAKEQAIAQARNKLQEFVHKQEDIINEYINTNEGSDYIEVEVIYEVLEDIGTEEKIAL